MMIGDKYSFLNCVCKLCTQKTLPDVVNDTMIFRNTVARDLEDSGIKSREGVGFVKSSD